LQIPDSSDAVPVGASGDEPQVSGLVAPVDVDAVKFEFRLVPAVKPHEIGEVCCSVLSPRFVNMDAAPAVVGEPCVVWVVAAVDAGGYAVAEPTPVVVVRAYIGVSEPVFPPLGHGFLGATVAPCAGAPAEIADVDWVRGCAARALNDHASQPTPWAEVKTNDLKLAEPVADARSRKVWQEATVFADRQVSPHSTSWSGVISTPSSSITSRFPRSISP
jgi:hypothetical protein